MSDEQLVNGCKAEDAFYQKCLYERFQAKMLGICIRYMKNRTEAQDVLQDGFIQVFRKLSTYKGKGSLEGWIRKIMVNTALQTLRKNQKLAYQESIDVLEEQIGNQEFILDTLAANDILRFINELPIGYRTVFNLYAIEGYSHAEIAEELNISVNTSFSQFSRAKSLLKKLIVANEVTHHEKNN
jgi:RNA polymerase sigma factor (sigma-70 family)